MTRIITSLSDIAKDYDAAFVDLWGCLHNGIAAYPAAVEACRAFRAAGKQVVLLTNAPRPRAGVEAQIARLGIPEDAWDTIATSGDSARAAMFRGAVGGKVWFMGEARDRSFFDPIRLVEDPIAIETVRLEDAEGIVCCGPFDPLAEPEVNRPEFLFAKARGLKLLCANPDIVVDRGETREWCAGALAQLYTDMGGESLYFGKPHPPIYDLARARLFEATGREAPREILCIGDGPGTDILGAMGEDYDSLLITGGLLAAETGTGPAPDSQPDPDRLAAALATAPVPPTFAMGYLK